MEFTAQQIAGMIGGTIEGDENATVHTLSKIEEGSAGSLSFLANPKYTQHIYSTSASIIIVANTFVADQEIGPTLIRVADPYSAFAELLEMYNQIFQKKPGISDLACIAPSASLGDDCYIGEFVSIGEHARIGNNVKIYPNTFLGDDVRIGDDTVLHAGVKIYAHGVIGSNCTIHAGATLGADGFGFAPQGDNNYKKVAQIGNVVIEDNVEIGSGTTIDRATLGSTIIRKGAKLDNLIQVAHNCEIGENTVIAAQTGISGSTKIGKNCMIGGQVGITGHLMIGDEVKIAAQSGISTNLKDGAIVMGSPSFEIGRYRKAYVHFRNLGSIVDRLNALEKQVREKE